MTQQEATDKLKEQTIMMDSSISDFTATATITQEKIYGYLLAAINKFEINDGRFVANQDFGRRFGIIQKEIKSILAKDYMPSIKEYLNTYTSIDKSISGLHKSFNELEIDKNILTAARRTIYDQAEFYLTQSLNEAYVQPAKYLLMQGITNGITIKQGQDLLKNWNEGDLNAGKITSGRKYPRLQAYTGQIARDSMFQYNGVIQDKIGEQYGLTNFIYVGGLVADSRPLCKHLVGLRRKIALSEIPKLIEQYPEGVIPNTTMKNFPIYRGGWNCLHNCMMVR